MYTLFDPTGNVKVNGAKGNGFAVVTSFRSTPVPSVTIIFATVKGAVVVVILPAGFIIRLEDPNTILLFNVKTPSTDIDPVRLFSTFVPVIIKFR